jgi:hypothetical protein
MSTKVTVAAICAIFTLFLSGQSAHAQLGSISVTPGQPVAPNPPNTNWQYPAAGTYVLPAGGTLSKIKCELIYYTYNKNNPNNPIFHLEQTKDATIGANGNYSVSFNAVQRAYSIRVTLITVGNANGVATDEQPF